MIFKEGSIYRVRDRCKHGGGSGSPPPDGMAGILIRMNKDYELHETSVEKVEVVDIRTEEKTRIYNCLLDEL